VVSGLFDVTDAALGVALRGAELRQTVLANNLANVNTPGFKRSDVSFEQALGSALGSGESPDQVASMQPSAVTDTATSMRADGNNVDVDQESTSLAETQILFDTAMAIESNRMHTLSSLINNAR
jgi:flagellar basal-body rod protein FlgB